MMTSGCGENESECLLELDFSRQAVLDRFIIL